VTGKRTLAIVLVFVVAAAVTTGIVIIGSPGEERTRRLDARRVEDLQAISSAIQVYHGRHQRLPESLGELSQERGLSVVPRDPVTGQSYGYRTLNANSYALCGAFDRESADTRPADFWSHGGGTQCFALDVKPTPTVTGGIDIR
jgi:hypothetical protein